MTNTLTSTSPSTDTTHTPLAGRVAVVTGGSSGIGAAIARRFAGAGAVVAAVARRVDRLDALADLGTGVTPIQADVTDAGAIAAAIERITAELGPPDLVVANAGVGLTGPAHEADLASWQRTFDVNVGGVAATVAATLPHLLAGADAGKTADLVLVSSIADAISLPGFAAYSASKAAVTKFSHDLRLELAPRGVRLLNLRPGLVATEIQEHFEDPGIRATFDEMLATMAPLSADEVADAVLAAVALPRHVNISELAIMPTGQPAPV